jgi:hypothetical protein
LTFLFLIALALALSPKGIVQHNQHYCTYNVHPTQSAYVGPDDLTACTKKCEELQCSCFNTSNKQGQYACHITSSSTTISVSSAGYTAYVANNWSGGNGKANVTVNSLAHQNHSVISGRAVAGAHQILIQQQESTFSSPNLCNKPCCNRLCERSWNQIRSSALHPTPHFQDHALNFTLLDVAMEELIKPDLSPGFEVMGNPGSFFLKILL